MPCYIMTSVVVGFIIATEITRMKRVFKKRSAARAAADAKKPKTAVDHKKTGATPQHKPPVGVNGTAKSKKKDSDGTDSASPAASPATTRQRAATVAFNAAGTSRGPAAASQ